MKKYLPVLFLIITAMAFIPVLANHDIFSAYTLSAATPVSAAISSDSYPIPDTLTFTDLSDGKTVSRSAKSVLYSLVGAACDNDFTADQVKSLCIAFHTQLCIENENGTLAINTKDKSVYLSESELKNKFSSDYTALCSYCDNVYTALLTSADGSLSPANTLSFCSKPNNTKTLVADPYDTLYSPDFAGETAGITPVLAKLMSQQGLTYTEILNYCYNI